MPVEQKLTHEWTTNKLTVEGDNPKIVLKGEDHDNSVKFKVEITLESGAIPSDYKKVFGKPGDIIKVIFESLSRQSELGGE